MRQLVQNIPSGIYELRYIYAATSRVSLAAAQIYTYFNETLMDQKSALNYNWTIATVTNLTMPNDNTTFYIKFCGNMSISHYGVAIYSVSFKKIRDLPVVVIPIILNTTDQNQNVTQNTTT
jgi:hypothetical protein